MGFIGDIWNLIILQPVLNTLIVLYSFLAHNFGLTIIALTAIVRLLTLPLTLKQLRSSRAMQEVQSQLAKLQKKYAKDKQKLAQEQMRLYKEYKISPLGCMVPLLVQMPVWIALYQSIIHALAATPEEFLSLSRYLYSWPLVHSMLPLLRNFLWLDLAVPDGWLVLPVLVAGSMWVQQKMTTPPSVDPQQEGRNRMMLWMMPLMFGFFTLSFPSGLALYWIVSNIIGIIIQYHFGGGWGGLKRAKSLPPPRS